jgi:tetratricopeptide (TPR) repeat protein
MLRRSRQERAAGNHSRRVTETPAKLQKALWSWSLISRKRTSRFPTFDRDTIGIGRARKASMRRALELAPGNADLLLNAAAVAGNLGYLDESIALCRRALALDPINALGHRYLGSYSRLANLPERLKHHRTRY